MTGPGAGPPREVALARPFGLVGRIAQADVALDDRDVSARHVYLHADARGVFAVDLSTRTGTRFDGRDAPCGWLRPGEAIEVAGRLVRLAAMAVDGRHVHPAPLRRQPPGRRRRRPAGQPHPRAGRPAGLVLGARLRDGLHRPGRHLRHPAQPGERVADPLRPAADPPPCLRDRPPRPGHPGQRPAAPGRALAPRRRRALARAGPVRRPDRPRPRLETVPAGLAGPAGRPPPDRRAAVDPRPPGAPRRRRPGLPAGAGPARVARRRPRLHARRAPRRPRRDDPPPGRPPAIRGPDPPAPPGPVRLPRPRAPARDRLDAIAEAVRRIEDRVPAPAPPPPAPAGPAPARPGRAGAARDLPPAPGDRPTSRSFETAAWLLDRLDKMAPSENKSKFSLQSIMARLSRDDPAPTTSPPTTSPPPAPHPSPLRLPEAPGSPQRALRVREGKSLTRPTSIDPGRSQGPSRATRPAVSPFDLGHNPNRPPDRDGRNDCDGCDGRPRPGPSPRIHVTRDN